MGVFEFIKPLIFSTLTLKNPAMHKDKITGFFVSIEDFCIDFESETQKHLLESSTNKSRKRTASLEFELPSVQLSLCA